MSDFTGVIVYTNQCRLFDEFLLVSGSKCGSDHVTTVVIESRSTASVKLAANAPSFTDTDKYLRPGRRNFVFPVSSG